MSINHASKVALKTMMCYKAIGLSLDEHIYNYKKVIHRTYVDQESIKFLDYILSFYESLNEFEQHILVYEILEEGRHFKYWYENYRSKKSFNKTKRKVIKLMEEFVYEIE